MKAKNNNITKEIQLSADTISKSSTLTPKIEKSINLIIEAIKNGNKIILFGNGGSAADAQHIAAELMGKFQLKRRSYPAIALTDNSSTVTAIGNDFSFDDIFSRQCEGIVNNNDVVIGISTSGNSKNVIQGIKMAKKMKANTIGLLGSKGGKLKQIVDVPIIVSSTSTPKIQEVHRVVSHIICKIVEERLERK